ncbi:calmodulin-binding protein 60 D-like [Rhodamnia argentea]|uniref:Calmodulin-binding protein 60 D-like n=1 Tax=Rhodamnia argentea TaxID=178133 RepID=A0ABM3H756_9MYRT|nr:calmodulin-binding protein 60 D-like [Rhodamnia argentea]
MQKRALPSTSSGQQSQPKKPCLAPVNQVWHLGERNLVPRSFLTEEDVRRVIREELEHAKSHSTEYFQSCTGNALDDIIHSLENVVQKLKEAVEPANSHSPHLGRGNAKSMANNGGRNLHLQLQTKLLLPLFTGKKIEGDEGACIYVALIDMNTGDVVTSGPESSIKLDVVVLEGDFTKDNEENWAPEEFENYVVKEREGKGPLLAGDRIVKLKGGIGELGELIFTDNSSWNRSKKFRMGVKVASGFCGNTRIREAKTDAFPVKEHRGEAYRKHHPPASDDEVWRLEKISKDGICHEKLSEAGIYKVEDFLLQLFTNPKKLREILGKSITEKKWESLIRHAKTCKTKWKLYLDYPEDMGEHGAVFNTNGQLIGLIKDRAFLASHRLSAQEKEHGETIVKKAFDEWSDVREFNDEAFSGSMQKKRSSSSPSQVFEGQIGNLSPVQRDLAPPFCVTPVGPKPPLASGISNVEVLSPVHNGVIASALPVRSQDPNFGNAMEVSVDKSVHLVAHQHIPGDRWNVIMSSGDNGITPVGSPSHDIISQYARQSQMMGSLSHMDYTATENVLPYEPPCASISSFQSGSTLSHTEGNHMMEDFQSIDLDDILRNLLADDPPHDEMFLETSLRDGGSVRGTSKGVNGWLKIKAVLQWGFFYRRGVRIVPLDESPNEVQARLIRS